MFAVGECSVTARIADRCAPVARQLDDAAEFLRAMPSLASVFGLDLAMMLVSYRLLVRRVGYERASEYGVDCAHLCR
jgi:hypothetical protein